MQKLVVFGLIKNNRILVMKRPSDHVNEPGALTLPAGHVEDGERPQEAAYRELKEEFGIVDVELHLLKGPYSHTSKRNTQYEVYFYLVKNWDGTFTNVENQDVFFVDLNPQNISMIDIESSREILLQYIAESH